MNERSSRSHTLFTMTVESRLREGQEEDDGTVRVATLVSGGRGDRLKRQTFFHPWRGRVATLRGRRGEKKEGVEVGSGLH